ncbi:Serine--tRNA ligase [Candidatus Kinetoplastibacterium sorsogonicusi]|uniref:Serine--tRNA ligase n=1 Tax=Candidatus Kinetoplastidibacterium kentomonadis TaxID=1576550 RepID=A0A3S7JAA2_9PROT|nr:serine--tRNA ligase [Candidatus Kinetoplastibacterium sorsogonicusi]AWD32607.1 Serine--tRNA ligase [Candidatus Kinetoplastibacterium sorsogonicusi]
MLDLNLLKKDIEKVINRLKFRGFNFDQKKFDTLEHKRKSIQIETEKYQSIRNNLAKKIGYLKKNNENYSNLLKESKELIDKVKNLENELNLVLSELNDFLSMIPNLPNENVPFGLDSENNKEIKKWIPKGISSNFVLKNSNFVPKDHVVIGEKLGLNLSIAAKMSGARFSFMHGNIAKLYRAISQFMLDLHTQMHGYTECYTPFIVNQSVLFGAGQLPKFQNEMFIVSKGSNINNIYDKEEKQYLISTAEIPLVNTVKDSILSLKDMPIKLVAYTPCFRSEAGSSGKDTKGIIRQHQFDKVELVQISTPEFSYQCMEDILQHAEKVLQLLEIPYRVVLLCSGDMGFSSAKTYDIEVWIPSQNTWREISSISNCESFQARRMHAKYRNNNGKLEFVHTLNGSALAIGRTLIAILENYQLENGDVLIPDVLKKYMNNQSLL